MAWSGNVKVQNHELHHKFLMNCWFLVWGLAKKDECGLGPWRLAMNILGRYSGRYFEQSRSCREFDCQGKTDPKVLEKFPGSFWEAARNGQH